MNTDFASRFSFLLFAGFCLLSLKPAQAQQTINLTRGTCSISGAEVSLACHWQNSNMSCTYNCTTFQGADSGTSCIGSGIQKIQEQSQQGNVITNAVTSCDTTQTMNAQCSNQPTTCTEVVTSTTHVCSGDPGFTCCSGNPVCDSGGSWSCSGATSCSEPPTQYVCNQGEYGSPACGCSNGWYCNTGSSPIVIDTAGTGFHLTSPPSGVMFDISGTGTPVQIAWTAQGSGNGWLVLDRNGNGLIDGGKELFGNYTEQPPSQQPNGFLALAEFDKQENGGNEDGIIDSNDAVFSRLRIWIDDNHDGISQTGELHTLPELGVFSIGLRYHEKHFADKYGNWFRYRAAVNPDSRGRESKDGRWTYDVFLNVGGTKAATAKRSINRKISAADHQLR